MDKAMEFNELNHARRSIRRYRKESVKREDIEQMIEAAQLAPSWKNSQTARYHVILDKNLLEQAKEQALPAFNANNAANAPVLIVTSFVKNHAGFDQAGNPANELGNSWGAYDLGLQNQNLILKAKELGLDTLIMGIRDAEVLKNLLKIDSSQIIVSVIAVGYRDIDPEAPQRKQKDEIIQFY